MIVRFLKNIFPFVLTVTAVILPTAALAQITGDGCGVTTDAVKQAEVDRKAAAITPATTRDAFSCQSISSGSAAASDRCVTGLCPSYPSSVLCCAPSTGGSPSASGGSAGGSGTATPVTRPAGSLQLPACVEDGNCGLDDLVQTGVYFANFLFGISGAIFLAIFVYAGFKYIWFSSNAGEIGKAKSMLVNATVGMILIISAGVLVNFVYQAVIGTSGGGGTATENTCERNHPGYTCTSLSSDATTRDREITSRSCIRNQCLASPDNVVCCPSSSATP